MKDQRDTQRAEHPDDVEPSNDNWRRLGDVIWKGVMPRITSARPTGHSDVVADEGGDGSPAPLMELQEGDGHA